MKDGAVIRIDVDGTRKIMLNYFWNRLIPHKESLEFILPDVSKHVEEQDSSLLKEVLCVKSVSSNKAPSPDDRLSTFFKAYWGDIKQCCESGDVNSHSKISMSG